MAQDGIAESGQLHGVVEHSGTAEVSGLDGGAFIVDTTENRTRWLKGSESSDTGVRFRAEDGHRYLVVDSQAVLSPEVRQPLPIRLHRIRAGAKYVVVGPETLLEAAWPLLELRASQGLSSLAVSMEQIYSEFGHGETRPQALRDFLSHAYHHWENRPRYVLLLGDGTFDFKDYIGYGIVNQVPPYPLKTTYLWTASDPAYASVNGEDWLPDLAIGRLPAANLEEAHAMVQKILVYETDGLGLLDGRAVLVADNPDPAAGDFVANAEEIGRDIRKIYLDELGTAATHESILQAFDEGASLMSYIGHGGMQMWNHNILRVADVDSLGAQSHQPLLLTMNCLNGYFPSCAKTRPF